MADPIQDEYRTAMNLIANVLDSAFNGDKRGKDREIAFVVLISRFNEIDNGRVNYISNGEREDIISMLKEITARFEGRYVDQEGTT